MRVRLLTGPACTGAQLARVREGCALLLAGQPVDVEVVDELPPTRAGKHPLVVAAKP